MEAVKEQSPTVKEQTPPVKNEEDEKVDIVENEQIEPMPEKDSEHSAI